VAQLYDVLRPEGYSERAIFIIDKLGIIRYVDVHDIDEQPDNEELFRVLEVLEPNAVRAQPVVEPQPEPEPAAEVLLYCTPWCPDCRRARAYLKENGIDFVEVDIIRNRAAAERVRGWADGSETTPIFKIGDQVLIGFNRAKLDQIFFK
jgi:glutaredoxin